MAKFGHYCTTCATLPGDEDYPLVDSKLVRDRLACNGIRNLQVNNLTQSLLLTCLISFYGLLLQQLHQIFIACLAVSCCHCCCHCHLPTLLWVLPHSALHPPPLLCLIVVLFLSCALLAPAVFNNNKRHRALSSSLINDGGISAHPSAFVIAVPLKIALVLFARRCHRRLLPNHLVIVVLCLFRLPTKTCIVDVVVRVTAAAVESLAESFIPLLPHCHCPLLSSPLPLLFVDCCFLCPGGMCHLALSLASSALSPPPFVLVGGSNGGNRRRQKLFLLSHKHCRCCCCCRRRASAVQKEEGEQLALSSILPPAQGDAPPFLCMGHCDRHRGPPCCKR